MNEAKDLTLEAGKFYRTRDGRKAFVAAVGSPFEKTIKSDQVIGWIDGTSGIRTAWHPDGRFYDFDAGDEDATDLIAEWVELKRIKGWVNIYSETSLGCIHATRELADQNAKLCGKPLACIEIDVLEGAGLGEAA